MGREWHCDLCLRLSEGHDVTLVLLQGWAGSCSFCSWWRAFIYCGVSHIEGCRRECARQVRAAALHCNDDDDDEDDDDEDADEEHLRHWRDALLRFEAAVLGCG